MGEESNKFGEVIIEATESEESTRKMLMNVLDEDAARKLSEELHRQIINAYEQFEINFQGDTSNVGLWLDPIGTKGITKSSKKRLKLI